MPSHNHSPKRQVLAAILFVKNEFEGGMGAVYRAEDSSGCTRARQIADSMDSAAWSLA